MAHDDDYQVGQKKSCSQKCDDFMKSIWNSEKKEFIGRTGGSWAKIGLFYLIFYSCLAGFFAIMLVGFFSTVDSNEPTQQGMYSLIKGNPGMGFRPMPNVESTLIRFTVGKRDTYQKHIDSINELLKLYKSKEEASNVVDCKVTDPDLNRKEVCKFDMSDLGPNCTAENDFGYKNGTPCVLLKVNKVFGWVPKPFDNESLADVNDHHAQDAKAKLGPRINSDDIGITCEGENEGDADNVYKVTYFPGTGFSKRFFPYKNFQNYMPPLVAVQLNVRKGALIQVWCKLWAKNIKHHKNDKAGSTHFELLVD
jgi:sodium/potassium-transporting ATPase subunit beta